MATGVSSVLQENMMKQWDLATSLVHKFINSKNPDEAIAGRQLELAMGGVERGEPLPRRVFHLMRKMKMEG